MSKGSFLSTTLRRQSGNTSCKSWRSRPTRYRRGFITNTSSDSDVASMFWIYPDEYPPGYQGYKLDPIIGANNPNITCGRAAFDSAHRTETADVLAGSEVGFRVSTDGNGNRNPEYSQYPNFWHPGPAQIYLSRAPNDDLQSYKGDGDWFKIAYAGPSDDRTWSLWPSVSDVRIPPLLVFKLASESRRVLTGSAPMCSVQLHHPTKHTARQVPNAHRELHAHSEHQLPSVLYQLRPCQHHWSRRGHSDRVCEVPRHIPRRRSR